MLENQFIPTDQVFYTFMKMLEYVHLLSAITPKLLRKSFHTTNESKQKIWLLLDGQNKNKKEYENGRLNHKGLWGNRINTWR